MLLQPHKRPSHPPQEALLKELAEAWLFTREQRVGILAGPETSVAEAQEAINAHHIWLTFWQEVRASCHSLVRCQLF